MFIIAKSEKQFELIVYKLLIITYRGDKMEIKERPERLPKANLLQLINLCIGAIGLQFAWSMQINLTSRVTEPLGATPLLLGLMWLAGPISGILVQPIIGTISDNIWTKFGRRRPFLLVGAILGALALVLLPYSSTLLMAAASLWIIDICVNVSQGPHRALVPDIMPSEQHSLANSFFSFAVGLGSVVAFGLPYFLNNVFHYQLSIHSQFIVASTVLVIAMGWTCLSTKEQYKPEKKKKESKESPFASIKMFLISACISGALVLTGIFAKLFGNIDFSSNDFITSILSWFVLILSFPMLAMALKSFYTKEIAKICAMQYFTWLGMMCLFIYFNNFVVHNVFHIPDLTYLSESIKNSYAAPIMNATNLSGLGFAAFNAVCVLVSIPLGLLCTKFGKKNIHAAALFIMSMSFLALAFLAKSKVSAVIFVATAGIGWASILTVPYALLMDNLKAGTEGSSLGKMNLFIAGPQILSSIAVGYLINKSPLTLGTGMITNHWEYAFIVGGVSILLASLIVLSVKEKKAEEKDSIEESIAPPEHEPIEV